jgi:hypothetical protein
LPPDWLALHPPQSHRYLTSCVFCIAPSGLLSADAELVQQVLVLSTAVSFLVGSGVSWAWLAYDQG